MFRSCAVAICLIASNLLADASLVVKINSDVTPIAANATLRDQKTTLKGTVDGRQVRFDKLPPGTKIDVDIPTQAGVTLVGVDMNWYSDEPGDPSAGPMIDDDHQQIRTICDVPSFYNKTNILLTQGNHDRAVLLVELLRDNGFHSDKGGEAVWHAELWYFKFQHGGWEKVQQQNRILGRERFKSPQQYQDAIRKVKWEPSLGGIVLQKDQQLIIELPPPSPATKPVEKPRERELD